MTVEEANLIIAKFLGLNQKSNKWELTPELVNIYKVKTISNVPKFNESIEALWVVVNKVSNLKGVSLATQFNNGKCEVYLYYKAIYLEGELKNAKFSASREKPIEKYNQALFEVITSFVGWLDSNGECYSEVEFGLKEVTEDNNEQSVLHYYPENITCPYCKQEIILKNLKPLKVEYSDEEVVKTNSGSDLDKAINYILETNNKPYVYKSDKVKALLTLNLNIDEIFNLFEEYPNLKSPRSYIEKYFNEVKNSNITFKTEESLKKILNNI